MKKAFINIKGMSCASDATDIERSLLKVKGVKSATVNYIVHEGFVYLNDNLTEEDLKLAVKRAGYNTTKIRFEEGKDG